MLLIKKLWYRENYLSYIVYKMFLSKGPGDFLTLIFLTFQQAKQGLQLY